MNGLTSGLGFFHSPFDKLRANGKILNLMVVPRSGGGVSEANKDKTNEEQFSVADDHTKNKARSAEWIVCR
jgi:hypothetical protein